MSDQDLYNWCNDEIKKYKINKIKKIKINKILYIKNLLYSFLKLYVYFIITTLKKQPKRAKNVKK